MDYFHYKEGRLFCEDVSVEDLVDKYSTPLYIYSLKTFVRHISNLQNAFEDLPHIVCYAAKANSNPAFLKIAAECGLGADIVSIGEYRLARSAGIRHGKIVFSGVGKTEEEIETALKGGLMFFCAESLEEIDSIAKIARKLKKIAPIAVRVNPAIDPKTHPYIATGLRKSKFGIDQRDAKAAYSLCYKDKWLDPVGISMHIGSQVETVKPYYDSVKKLVELYRYLWKQNGPLKYIDIGGGWAAQFDPAKEIPYPRDYISAVSGLLRKTPATIVVEPGRSLIGSAGILVMKVTRNKKSGNKNFCVVDAGMNDFIRPALYGGKHLIKPVVKGKDARMTCDIVGPVCESSDFFAKSVKLRKLRTGELLALFTAGAYGRVMGSNYNARLGAAEVAVAGDMAGLIAKRDTFADISRRFISARIGRETIRNLSQ